jgi:hypothetical protein
VDVMWSVAWAPPFLFESGGSVQHSQSPMTAGYGAVMGHSRMCGPRRKAKSEHIGKVHEDEQNQKGPLLKSKGAIQLMSRRKGDSTRQMVLAELGHSQNQNRPLTKSPSLEPGADRKICFEGGNAGS